MYEQQQAHPTQVISSLASLLFSIRTQVHVLHLQTTSFAEHKALNEFYDDILDLTDTLLENMIPMYGRPRGLVSSEVVDWQPGISKQILTQFHSEFCELCQYVSQSELKNIMDEIKAVINKTMYLLSLS